MVTTDTRTLPSPLTDDLLTEWVWRKGTSAHYVDSVVADAVITACGRRMHRLSSNGGLEQAPSNIDLGEQCQQCTSLVASRTMGQEGSSNE